MRCARRIRLPFGPCRSSRIPGRGPRNSISRNSQFRNFSTGCKKIEIHPTAETFLAFALQVSPHLGNYKDAKYSIQYSTEAAPIVKRLSGPNRKRGRRGSRIAVISGGMPMRTSIYTETTAITVALKNTLMQYHSHRTKHQSRSNKPNTCGKIRAHGETPQPRHNYVVNFALKNAQASHNKHTSPPNAGPQHDRNIRRGRRNPSPSNKDRRWRIPR